MSTNKQDQWFQPGDKVMRVSRVKMPGGTAHPYPDQDAQEGKIYCVSHCWVGGHGRNVILLVGLPVHHRPNGEPRGWFAANFRKVEEIKLCVAAVQRVKKPQTVTVKIPRNSRL